MAIINVLRRIYQIIKKLSNFPTCADIVISRNKVHPFAIMERFHFVLIFQPRNLLNLQGNMYGNYFWVRWDTETFSFKEILELFFKSWMRRGMSFLKINKHADQNKTMQGGFLIKINKMNALLALLFGTLIHEKKC